MDTVSMRLMYYQDSLRVLLDFKTIRDRNSAHKVEHSLVFYSFFYCLKICLFRQKKLAELSNLFMYIYASIFVKRTFLENNLYKSDAVSHQKKKILMRTEASLLSVTRINC